MVCRRGIAKAGESASRSVIVNDCLSLEHAHDSRAASLREVLWTGLLLCKSVREIHVLTASLLDQQEDHQFPEIYPHPIL